MGECWGDPPGILLIYAEGKAEGSIGHREQADKGVQAAPPMIEG